MAGRQRKMSLQGGASALYTNDSRKTAGDAVEDTKQVEFGLRQSSRYIPDLVLRIFPGRHDYPNFPYKEEMEAALLFADVSGFTPLTKTLQEKQGLVRGAEDLNRILSTYFDILIKSFHKHGGDVVSFSGDAMTVLFCEPGADGLKTAARRCAQCSLDILAQTSDWSLEAEGLDNKLTLHAGMGAGPIRAIQVGWANDKSRATSKGPAKKGVSFGGGGELRGPPPQEPLPGEPAAERCPPEGVQGQPRGVPPPRQEAQER